MREQINNNPVLQLGLVAVLLVVAGFLLLTSMGGGEEEEPSTTSTATIETPEASASLTVTTPTEGEAGAAPPTSVGSVSPIPKPRLPRPVHQAIEAGRTVLLLVVKKGGIDDARVEDAVEALASRPRVATFVVPVDQAPRYTAITQPVHLERAPALIVVQPQRLSRGVPTASINYGFQSIATIVQAVVDAEYRGAELLYHP